MGQERSCNRFGGCQERRSRVLLGAALLGSGRGNLLTLGSFNHGGRGDAIDGDQREFDHKTKVITNESKIVSKMFHNCALNK